MLLTPFPEEQIINIADGSDFLAKDVDANNRELSQDKEPNISVGTMLLETKRHLHIDFLTFSKSSTKNTAVT